MKHKTKRPATAPAVASSDIVMPIRFPDDNESVAALLDESERTNKLGARWLNAKHPNPIAAQRAFELGLSFANAAAWLRCYYKGELRPSRPCVKA